MTRPEASQTQTTAAQPTQRTEGTTSYRAPSQSGAHQFALGASALLSLFGVLMHFGPRIAELLTEIMGSMQPQTTSPEPTGPPVFGDQGEPKQRAADQGQPEQQRQGEQQRRR